MENEHNPPPFAQGVYNQGILVEVQFVEKESVPHNPGQIATVEAQVLLAGEVDDLDALLHRQGFSTTINRMSSADQSSRLAGRSSVVD